MPKKTRTRQTKALIVKALKAKYPTIKRNAFTKSLEKVTKIAMTSYLDVYQNSGAPAPFGFSTFLEYPMCFFSAGGAFGTVAISPANFARMNAVYDQYQVESLSARYYSNIPAEYGGDTVTYWTGGAGIPYGYCEKDYDDAVVPVTENQALNKGVPFSLMKSHSFKIRNERLRMKKWLNTSNINVRDVTTAVGTNINDDYRKESCLKYYCPLIPNGLAVGRIYFTWNIKYKSIRTV